MQWADVTRAQTPKTLRQFGLLALVVFGGMAVWRVVEGRTDGLAVGLGVAAVLFGAAGAIAPRALRPVFTVWMAAAFPIGFVVSRVLLATLYYGLFTPVAIAFRFMRRDALRLHRPDGATYWTAKSEAGDSASYFRQS
jgi:hypothetical protein